MKKILHLTSILICTFFLCFCVSPKPAHASTRTVSIELQYGQSEARDMLSMINAFRTNPSEAWVWNESSTSKITYPNLSALQYDYELERIAMLRAAEISISFSHTRPNGTNCFTAYGSSPYSSKGENIAYGYSSASAVFEGWKETDKSYSGQGHRRNMLDQSYNAIGIGHVYYNGTHYWVQELGYSSSPNTAATTANNNREVVNIETLSNYSPGIINGSTDYGREYYITFYANDGTQNNSGYQMTVNQRISNFPPVSRNGYTFKGWYTQPSGGTLVTTSTVFYSDTAVYAQWESSSAGGFSNFSVTTVTETTATVSASIPLRYIRTYGIALGTSSSYMTDTRSIDCYATTSMLTVPLTGLTPDTTYYYRLYFISDTDRVESMVGSFTTKKASEYIITFYGNGGTVEGLSSITTVNQKLPYLPNAYRENYIFNGWFSDSYGGTQITTSTVFNTNGSVYAHWTYQQPAQVPSNPPASTPSSGNDSTNNGNSVIIDTGYSSDPEDDDDEPVVVSKVKLKSLTNTGKGKLKVKWSWNAYSDGYQIAYSTTQKFSSNKTKLKNAGVFTESKTLTGLKKGTVYYVRVRAFQKVDGIKYYSGWSNVKKLKLTK